MADTEVPASSQALSCRSLILRCIPVFAPIWHAFWGWESSRHALWTCLINIVSLVGDVDKQLQRLEHCSCTGLRDARCRLLLIRNCSTQFAEKEDSRWMVWLARRGFSSLSARLAVRDGKTNLFNCMPRGQRECFIQGLVWRWSCLTLTWRIGNHGV